MYFPMLYNYNSAFKRDNKALCYKEFKIVVAAPHHALYLFGVIYKAVVVGSHR